MKYVIIYLIFFTTITTFAQWTQCNGPYISISINSLTSEGSTLYAGTNNGAFKTTDYGASWDAINSGLPAYIINCISSIDSTLYIAPQSSSTFMGVFKSTNEGANWIPTGVLPTNYIRSIIPHGSNVYVGTGGSGVYYSSNGGDDWIPSNTGLTDLYINSLTSDGTNLYASTYYNGVYLSTDNGTSWSSSNAGVSPFDIQTIVVKSIGLNIYSAKTSDLGGVYISTNSGINWFQSTSGITAFMHFTSIEGFENNIFVSNPTGGVFYSSNSGASWTAFNDGLTSGLIMCLKICGPYLFAGEGNGKVYRRAIQNVDVEDFIANQTKIYPNPNNGTFNILTKLDNCYVIVRDISGRHLFTSNIANEIKVDLSLYPKGTYLITIYSDTYKELSHKIIIE